MLQRILNIKKVFQRRKPEVCVSEANVHGTRCLLHVTNLALFGVVLILTITSALIYYLVPITTVSELSKTLDIQKTGIELDSESPDSEPVNEDSKDKDKVVNEAFSVINERNVFSHKRKEWVVKAAIPKLSELKNKRKVRADLAKKALAKKKAQAGKPKKIILHGVVLAGGIKKALINNPLKGVSKKKTMYVEEGDELQGYKVTSIEKDLIRLDWHGEEIVVTLYSGLKNLKKGDNARKGKRGGLTKLKYKYSIVEEVREEESSDVGNIEVEKVAHAEVIDGISLKPENKGLESFSMLDFDSAQSSTVVGMQDIAETFPDIESNDIDSSEEEKEAVTTLEYKFKVIDDHPSEEKSEVGDVEVENVALTGITDNTTLHFVNNESEYLSMPSFSTPQPPLIDLAVISKPEQKLSTEDPSEIILHGIVIVTSKDIKKALVNIPMSPFRKERTLYVEEGDAFEGFKVTSIEPDLLRLDWHGKEMVVKFLLL